MTGGFCTSVPGTGLPLPLEPLPPPPLALLPLVPPQLASNEAVSKMIGPTSERISIRLKQLIRKRRRGKDLSRVGPRPTSVRRRTDGFLPGGYGPVETLRAGVPEPPGPDVPGAVDYSVEARLSRPSSVALIGNSLPRRCGIATFTTDLQQAIAKSRVEVETAIVAMTDHGQTYDYPPIVRLQVNDGDVEEYARAADFLNAEQFDSYACSMSSAFSVARPATTSWRCCHVWQCRSSRRCTRFSPSPSQCSARSSTGLSRSPRRSSSWPRRAGNCCAAFTRPRPRRSKSSRTAFPIRHSSNLTRRRPNSASVAKPIILTFGLLSPNKGIEVMIDAMPAILKSRADAVYVVLGATHPNLVRREGRGLSREPDGARASARRRGARRISRPVRRSGDVARIHLDV